MKVTVDRFASDHHTTLSLVLIDGLFECFGLEDEYRETKVMAETRIPAGEYKIGLRSVGRFHKRYSARFPAIHKGMLELINVPNFEYVLIHCGNSDDDTAGCLLVGASANATPGNMSIGSSRLAYERFYPKVIQAALDDDLEIEIIDSDR